MLYSKTCEYAVRSLAYLSRQPQGKLRGVPEVSRETGVPGPYVAKIFQHLVGAGILRSSRGKGGGFALDREPATLSLLEIINAIDDIGPWEECVMGLDRCNNDNGCPVHTIWKKARERITAKLKRTTLAGMNKKIGKAGYRDLKRAKLNL
ncbi:MAG: Rrf2 family transcriptional regulator [Candidatus Omnitrophota bacterium]|nr:Rrf2 family transcriptional regulator [Candidatus Omnitrophota bacterium]